MTIAEDWKLYWDKTSSDGYGTEIYFSRVNDGTEEDHMPIATVRSASSLCISNSNIYRWCPATEEWEIM